MLLYFGYLFANRESCAQQAFKDAIIIPIGDNLARKEGKLTAAIKLQYIEDISLITTQLSKNECTFSHVLNKAARDIKAFLQWANILFILFILLLASLFAFRMMDSLSASEKVLKVTIIELNDANKELEHFLT